MAALSEIQKLEARYAENPDGRFFAPLADAYRKAGDVDRALELIQGNLPKHPDYLSAHIVLGRCHLDKKDDAGAMRAFQKVLDLDSENIIALKSLAEISERMGQSEDARRWLMRLLTVDAMNSEAEEDLNRLGGPLPEATEGTEVTEPTEPGRVSFADLTEEPVVTVPVEAIHLEPEVPKTLERPAVPMPPPRELTEAKTLGFPPVPPPATGLPAIEMEPTAFEPPAEVPAEQESLLAPAIDFLGAEPTAAPAPMASDVTAPEPMPEDRRERIRTADELNVEERKATRERVSESEFEGFGVAPTHDADATDVPPLVLEAPMEPPTVSTVDAPPEQSLPLIMPEDVTPPEEMRRPSVKLIQQVAPQEDAAGAEPTGALMVTETMAELYLQQGLRSQAADVYRQLLSQRPGDESLRAKLAALESPPAMSAAALGTEAVGSWLRRIARATLPAGAPAAPPEPPPAAEPTPMDQAFAADADEPVGGGSAGTETAGTRPAATETVETAGTRPAATEPAATEHAATEAAGEPARPASTAYSLDSIFGTPQAPAAEPASQKHPLGASFDEFFGGTPAAPAESARPREGEAPRSGGDDDLSAFNAWLHGLKS